MTQERVDAEPMSAAGHVEIDEAVSAGEKRCRALLVVVPALAFGRVARVWKAVGRHQRVVQIAGGLLLVVVGVMLVTGAWTSLVHEIQSVMPFSPAV